MGKDKERSIYELGKFSLELPEGKGHITKLLIVCLFYIIVLCILCLAMIWICCHVPMEQMLGFVPLLMLMGRILSRNRKPV
ncbi:hypothetical protein J2T02_002593 [Chitinophaga terrae (ex Kim and Jung 2007)]|nr:hypothetical protein [Chitinophaga terrae (ex Kim and Jung 2007)]